MARRKSKPPQKDNAPGVHHDRVQPWLSAGVAALLVMQVLLPGDGVVLVELLLAFKAADLDFKADHAAD